MLERAIPFTAVEITRQIESILTEIPLKFRYGGLEIVATKQNGHPRIISVWMS
jgi:hypothetical protein